MTGEFGGVFRRAVSLIRGDVVYIPLFMLLDIIFLISFANVFVRLNLRIISIIRDVEATTSKLLDTASNVTSAMVPGVLEKQQEVMQQLDEITRLVIILIISLYLLWSAFQGGALSLVVWRVRKRPRPWQYLWQFFAYNAVMFGIISLITYLYLKVSVFNRMYIYSFAGQSIFNWMMLLLLLFIGYLVYVGYARLGTSDFQGLLRWQFVEPFRGLTYLNRYIFSVVTLLIGLLIYLLLFYVFIGSALIFLSLVYLFVVLLPYMTFLRYLQLSGSDETVEGRKGHNRRSRKRAHSSSKGSQSSDRSGKKK